MALDHGRARTGVAVSDPTGTIARPLAVIERVDSPAGRSALEALIADERPEVIVVGEPLHLSGARGEQAATAARFAARLRKRVDVPVELVDERLTTAEAGRRASEAGSQSSLDSLSACVLLEAYLARQA